MNEYFMFALALSPLLLMVFLILKLKMPIHYSVMISLVFTAALSAIFWEMPVQNLKAAIGYGALKGLWPIVIVILGAIFSYNVMQATKALDILRDMLDILRDILASISEDKRIQVLLISWCFGGFLEAAAGYGTAVAIPIGILIALGFNPLKAAIASLVANTVPTAFGAVGIPVSILAEQVNLPVYTLGGTIILQLALFNILLPFVIVCIIGGGLKAIRGVFLITLICGITTLVPQYFVAIHLGAELPAFAGSLVSLFAVAMVSRLRKGKTDPEWRIEVSHTRETTPRSAKVLFRVGSIYLFIFVFILMCSPLFPTIKGAASQLASVLHFTLADGKTMALKVEWVTTPGMLIVALATVMDLSGIISTLAQSIVDLTGSSYVFLAPVIGALGTFVTGSDTNSNILFGKLQTIAASKLHIDPNWLAAANTSGATGGKMISPQSIAIAVSATKMDGQANQIMSGTMKYCCAYIVILGLKVGLFYYWFMA
ncbi:MAG: L-lactate permease [Citrobacter freundii]|nr:L-lactate permease [Citrobacter freundii]